jgi:D-alanine-D-alanine ligase-like ATP-grasp enzyme
MRQTASLPQVNNRSQWYREEMLSARRVLEFVLTRMPSEERRLEQSFEALRIRFFDNYWATVAREIGADIENMGYGFHRLRKGHQSTFVNRGEVMLDNHLTLRIAGNKPLVYRLLLERGYRIPEHLEYNLRDIEKAVRFMKDSGGNCVVKPANGAAGGRGVSTKINSRSRLLQASCKASLYSSNAALMIEKEHVGNNYRLLFLNGQLIDAIRRESPKLVGDGYSSVHALVEKENARRLQVSNHALSPLTMDLDARYTLADQGMTSRHFPAANTIVKIKSTSNQNSKNENCTVKDSIHSSIIGFCRDINSVFGIALSGVDLMLKDHTLPLHKSFCCFNEINTTPGLHHHALVLNNQSEVKVGSILMNYILNVVNRR